MASKFLWPQLVQARRQMGSLSATKSALAPSGLKTTSVESDSEIASVAILVKSGPAYESYDNLGVSHALRLAVGQSTANITGFGINRTINHLGAKMTVTGSRDYLLYSLTCQENRLRLLFDFFSEIVSSPSFKPWEIGEAHEVERMSFDLASVDLPTQTMELLHKAAYRTGLGNSLYSPEYMVGKHKTQALLDFHQNTHTLSRAVLVGHGVDSRDMGQYASLVKLGSGQGLNSNNKYYGGEERQHGGGNLTYIAIAGESAPHSNGKDAMASLLLKNILGTAGRVKRVDGSGKLIKELSKIEGEKAVSGINCTYDSSGLTGAFVVCNSKVAGKVVNETVAALRNLTITSEEVAAAKKAVLVDHAENIQNPVSAVEALGVQAMFGSGDDVTDLISMVSLSDVQAAAKRLANGKLSMASAGNIANVPYLDSL